MRIFKFLDVFTYRLLFVVAVMQLVFLVTLESPKTTWQDFRESLFMACALYLLHSFDADVTRLKKAVEAKEPQ
jgi:hypothetical protein